MGNSTNHEPGLVDAYLTGEISRRTFVRRMVAAGISLGAAVTYAHVLRAAPAHATHGGVGDHYEAPAAITLDALDIAESGATLRGEVDANHVAASAWFEYGPTQSYGSATPEQAIPASAEGSLVAISAAIAGLEPATAYHFRVVAESQNGRTEGQDRTFETLSIEPSIEETLLELGDELLECERRDIAISDLVRTGRKRTRARVGGVARSTLVGTEVAIMMLIGKNAKQVAEATVGPDGSFDTTIELPRRRRQLERVRVGARATESEGKTATSRAVKLTRRAWLTAAASADGRTTIGGQINAPRAKDAPKVVIERRVACTGAPQWRKLASGKQRKDGSFVVAFPNPEELAGSIIRARTMYAEKRGTPAKRRTATLAAVVAFE